MIDYPELPKSYRRRFPFKICSTSFIYPDMYAPNIRKLGPYLDEVELLFFDSTYDGSLPSSDQIDEILLLLNHFNITCNVHLPLDISLGDREISQRLRAVETVRHILRLTAPLSPSTYTVHFTYEDKDCSQIAVKSWQERILDSVNDILKEKISVKNFSVENLSEYPFEWIDPIIARTGIHTCIDIGHFLKRGEDFNVAFLKYAHVTDILHIYGVKGDLDHLSLEFLSEKSKKSIISILKNFSGTVSVEVFSFNRLKTSLALMDSWGIF